MTTTKSFNLSVENIAKRGGVVLTKPIFGANGSCGNFENVQGFLRPCSPLYFSP